MNKTQEEKQKYVYKIFKDVTLFELEVLQVSSHYDRLEIIKILAHTLVRDKLKYEINFLYLKSYDDFKFTQIVNIIFHEIANEWISFATDILYYPRKEAIHELQDKQRVKFIHSLAKGYYDQYKRKIFEEIADTFVELVSNVKQDKESTMLIQKTLQSDLIKNRQILEMHNFSQLFSRIKSAKSIKNSDIITTKMKVVELNDKCSNQDTNADEKKKCYRLLEIAKKELDNLKDQGLDKFDPGIKRLKDTMVQSMIAMS